MKGGHASKAATRLCVAAPLDQRLPRFTLFYPGIRFCTSSITGIGSGA